MRILVFTTVYPNAAQPLHGLFVAERTRHAARLADTRVVAPVPWFLRMGGRSQPRTSVPVTHPRFYYLPGLFKFIDGLLLFLSAMFAVWRLRRQFDFDLIDAHFGFPDGVAAVLLGYWFGRPVTVTLRGSELEMVRYRTRRLVLTWALNRADRIIAVSTELARLAVQLGVPPERVRVIGNGVDLTLFQPIDRKQARRSLNIPETAPLIVAVGHLARVKGFDLVLRAMPAIASAHKGLRFVIVGGAAASSGDYPAYLSAEIARLNLSDQVTITGAVTPAQVALWLNAADLFILASEREGSPNALREALACGCPIVSSDVGDARELLNAGAGLVVADRARPEQWEKTVSKALDTPWDRAAIRAEAEQHTWTRVAERVASEWRACVGHEEDATPARDAGSGKSTRQPGAH